MTVDPPRFLEQEEQSFEQQLLGSAEIDVGSDRVRTACLTTLAASATLATGAAEAAGGGMGGALHGVWLGKWVAATALVGAGVVAVTWVASPERASPAVVESVTPATRRPPKVAPQPLNPTPLAVPSTSVQAPAAPERSAPPSSQSSLGEELKLLDRARASLQRGDAVGALLALDARDRAYPRGALGPEATVLRVQALLATGQRAQAERIAAPWLDRSGPHADRLRGLLGANKP